MIWKNVTFKGNFTEILKNKYRSNRLKHVGHFGRKFNFDVKSDPTSISHIRQT
jgi:hypothetical protein